MPIIIITHNGNKKKVLFNSVGVCCFGGLHLLVIATTTSSGSHCGWCAIIEQ